GASVSPSSTNLRFSIRPIRLSSEKGKKTHLSFPEQCRPVLPSVTFVMGFVPRTGAGVVGWQKWLKTTLLDEFNRINVIKGQQAKGRGLTAVAPRRQAVVEALQECPVQKWIAVATAKSP